MFSGMQPSADSLHLGNYAGALTQWVSMQNSYDAIFCVVDLHAITVPQNPAMLSENTLKTAAQYIACGIDPQKSTLFVQSHVAAHAKLAWILNTITSFGEASRMTQFKDKSIRHGAENATVGLFTYPVLQAADILLYGSEVVPVGEDQRQHVELTRNLAERFNQKFGTVLKIPEARIIDSAAKIYDLQNPSSKMSKSGQSPQGIIWLLDEPEVIRKKIMSSVTDAGSTVRFEPKKKPGISNLLSLASVATGQSLSLVEEEFDGFGYGDFKSSVADSVIELVQPIQKRTLELLDDPAELSRVLGRGAEKAQNIANETLKRVQDAVGLLPKI